ncbi:MAG: hypothetical protein ABR581_01130 [Thermoleophilaceae bacterium]
MLRKPFTPLKAAVAVASVLLVGAGLAVAGVGLPKQAGEAGQNDSSPRSSDVLDVIKGTPTSDRGCEFGHAVATAARGSELPAQARAACDRGHGASERAKTNHRHARTVRQNRQSSAGRQFGQETSERAKGQRTATPEQRRQFGPETATRAHQLGGGPESVPRGGPGTGETHSQAGEHGASGGKP